MPVSYSRFLALGLVLGAGAAFGAPSRADGVAPPVQIPLDPPTTTTTTIPLNPATTAPVKRAGFTDEQIKALGQGPVFPYNLLDEALVGIVNDKGDVNYNKLHNNDPLGAFVRAVGLADLTQFPVFIDKDEDDKPVKNRSSETIFWINAYNAMFLQTVTKNYPVKSVSQIKDFETEQTHVVGGKNYSFAEMRKVIAELDRRALFVLPDGTRSGPRASPTAFRFSNLGAQLNAGIRAFVNDITRVPVPDRLGNSLAVSPWLQTIEPYYKDKSDKRKWSGIRSVLGAYIASGAVKRWIITGTSEVNFLPQSALINDTITAGEIGVSS